MAGATGSMRKWERAILCNLEGKAGAVIRLLSRSKRFCSCLCEGVAAVPANLMRCCCQVERQFDLRLPAADQPRPVRVYKIDLKVAADAPAVSVECSKYRIRFSNGSESDTLTFQELDGVARLLLAQEPAPRLARRGRPVGKKRGKLDLRRARQKNTTHNRQKRTVHGTELPILRTLRSYGNAATASELCRSVDGDWDRNLVDDKENIDKFPFTPTEDRVHLSIHKWRQLVSSPHIDMASCAVCAERTRKSLVRTFAVSDTNPGNFQKIGPAVLDFMQHQMVHDPLLPSHLSELPEGTCAKYQRSRSHCCTCCAVEMSALRNVALDDIGINREQYTINICTTCLSQLLHRRLPALSLANGLEFGRLPAELQSLTWAEQRLLAIYNVHLHLIHFRNEEVPGAQSPEYGKPQARFKGNAFCVPQDTVSVNRFLPPSPDQLPNYFQVLDRVCVAGFARENS